MAVSVAPATVSAFLQVFQIILMVFGVHAVEAYFLNPQVHIMVNRIVISTPSARRAS